MPGRRPSRSLRDGWGKGDTWETVRERVNKRLHRLWVPPPIDHPRTRAWIASLYGHHQHCYFDESKPKNDNDRTLIYPVPAYRLKSFKDDARFSDEWRTKEKASINQANQEILDYAAKIAIPENHQAVVIIRRYYPEYQPELELIDNPPTTTGNWFETSAERPTPETCPGQYGQKHPVNGSWCQWCGYKVEA